MTDLTLSKMALPIHKPVDEWDDLDRLIVQARADDISRLLQPACFRERQYRTTYVRPDGKLNDEPLIENLYQ